MSRAIFFDIDGTILDRPHGIKKITARVEKAMRDLQAAGHKIFIATGRPMAFIYPELLNFGFDGFVASNGAAVIIGGEVVFKSALDISIVKKVCARAEAEQIEYILGSYPEMYLPRGFKQMEKFCETIGVDYSNFVREFDFDKISVSKIECISARTDLQNLDAVYTEMLKTAGVTGWADPFHYKSMEISSDKVSKATGIAHALKYFNIDVADSCAFGDGINDREMIQFVGTGFAMGTGSDELKSFAKYVVPGVQEDGVAVGIERYILRE